jgi:hypothetical protein
MPVKKYFLVQFLVEADTTEYPEFNGLQAREHFRSAFKVPVEDKVIGIQVCLLAQKPDEWGDQLIEAYVDRGLEIEIYQDADTLGTDAPTYGGTAANPRAKQRTISLIANECLTVEAAKEVMRIYVDKRMERECKKAARQLEKEGATGTQ